MVKAKALKAIQNGNNIVAYRLKDENGLEMEVPCNQIITAIQNKAIQIENLQLQNGSLVMTQPKNEQSNTNNNDTDTKRMNQLVNKLNEANRVYEQGTDEIMTNYEYDKLYSELEALEKKTGITLPNSPTVNVGYEVVSKLEKKRHSVPMLSLGKTKDREELKAFLKDKEGVLSLKLDGLTVVLTYKKGKLVEALTRGNGEVGEVVTNNAKHFKNIPMQIPIKGDITIRGEALITYSTFNKINSTITIDSEKYKNPRNLCSGSVRQLDSKVSSQRGIIWKAFSQVDYKPAPDDAIQETPVMYDAQLSWLRSLGFDVVEHYRVNSNNILEVIEQFEEKVKESDIPSDGLVLTFRDTKYGKSLGNTAKSPRHSMAFKWKDETATTNLQYIEWSPSRTGLINPVAVFNPVDIEGSTVARASLHNISIVDETLGIPYVGQEIEVFKANMIIPKVLSGVKLEELGTQEGIRKLYTPDICPCCGEPTEVNEEPMSGVLTLWCTNDDCPAKGTRLFEHFVSRDAMNIDGISTSTLNTLAEEGIISDLASIFHIKEYRDEIVGLEGFGDKSFENMVNAIEKARSVKLANLIYALGIPNIGLSTAKLICKHFNNDLKEVVSANYTDLINIDGIGDTIADSFLNYFRDRTKAEEFVKLIKEVKLVHEEISTNTEMQGVTICVTGDVYIFPNRRAIKDLVESLGGKLTGSVSKSTSYLVTNDTTSGSNKNKAAQKYGIPILTEQEFIDKFNLQV